MCSSDQKVNFCDQFQQQKRQPFTRLPFESFCREDRIRTCDPLVPNQVFYRAELPPEALWIKKRTLLVRVFCGEGGIRTLGTV